MKLNHSDIPSVECARELCKKDAILHGNGIADSSLPAGTLFFPLFISSDLTLPFNEIE